MAEEPIKIPEEIFRHRRAIIKAHERRVKKSRKKMSEAEQIAWLCQCEMAFASYDKRGFLTLYDSHGILAGLGAYLLELPVENPDHKILYTWWRDTKISAQSTKS